MAVQPAPSSLLPPADPALRAEFSQMMDGFAHEKDETAGNAKASSDRRNAEQGVRAAKVAVIAGPPVLQSTPVARQVSPRVVTAVPLVAMGKPHMRRPAFTPKALPPVSRPDPRWRNYRQSLLSLFLTSAEALEECSALTSHMLRDVVRFH